MDVIEIKAPLLGSTEHGKPSPWRWWMLVWSALLSCAQGWIWNTFGPISQATERLWGWDDGTIAFMSNWGPIAYMVAFLPTSYLFDVYGLRLATLLSAVLVAVGCGVRLLAWVQATSSPTWILVYMHVGQCLNGLAGPVAMMSGPVLSAAWFPACVLPHPSLQPVQYTSEKAMPPWQQPTHDLHGDYHHLQRAWRSLLQLGWAGAGEDA